MPIDDQSTSQGQRLGLDVAVRARSVMTVMVDRPVLHRMSPHPIMAVRTAFGIDAAVPVEHGDVRGTADREPRFWRRRFPVEHEIAGLEIAFRAAHPPGHEGAGVAESVVVAAIRIGCATDEMTDCREP